jgi:hypothetical protein
MDRHSESLRTRRRCRENATIVCGLRRDFLHGRRKTGNSSAPAVDLARHQRTWRVLNQSDVLPGRMMVKTLTTEARWAACKRPEPETGSDAG